MTKFAIGCLVQWYEVNIIGEYLNSLKVAIDEYEKNNIVVDLTIVKNQELEEFDGSSQEFEDIIQRFELLLKPLTDSTCDIRYRYSDKLHSIADYRREFNNNYCEQVDVLIWGESDMIAPKQMFTVLNALHKQVHMETPKYLSFFGGCKMWDESWKLLEHPDFTDKPFIEGDTTNWWSLRYTMSESEMNRINDKTNELEVIVMPQHKFNGCGLVISSEVIKAGANIPKGMFFVHEDTAFMHVTNKLLGNIPQYVIRNILLVHNRKHFNKRYRVKGEQGIDPTNTGLLREQHSWYSRAYQASSDNLANLFNPNFKFKTWKDVI